MRADHSFGMSADGVRVWGWCSCGWFGPARLLGWPSGWVGRAVWVDPRLLVRNDWAYHGTPAVVRPVGWDDPSWLGWSGGGVEFPFGGWVG